MTDYYGTAQVNEDWHKARRRAFWSAVWNILRRRPTELMPFQEVKTRISIHGSKYCGLQHVPLDRIIGSEGRYSDFDRRFLPREERLRERWQNIGTARFHNISLPPVDLYKIGEVYFVKDGNHRVSVARQIGQADIDAYVTEYLVDVPLDPNLSMRDMLLKEEYSDFLEWTNLARLRPDQRIELSALGGYLELIQHINTHRYYIALERKAEVSPEEAITSWYDNVYMPVIAVVRRCNVLASFPGRSEADLYLWIMGHRNYLREFAGIDPGPEAATLDLTERFGHKGVLGRLGRAVATLRGVAGEVVHTLEPPSLELLDFVEWSHIDMICPDADVRVSHNEDYVRLRHHIIEHCYYLGLERQANVALSEGIEHWCHSLYTPVVNELRTTAALDRFPGQTETDLYLAVMDYMHDRKIEGIALDPAAAVKDYVAQAPTDGKSPLATLVERGRNLVRRTTE
ncbi:MAG: hypothetical protein NVS4B8_25530 [Herpetosiphon sp.]